MTSINTTETEDMTNDLNDLNAVMNALDWGSDDDVGIFSNDDNDGNYFTGGGTVGMPRDELASQAIAQGEPSLGDAGPSQGAVHFQLVSPH